MRARSASAARNAPLVRHRSESGLTVGVVHRMERPGEGAFEHVAELQAREALVLACRFGGEPGYRLDRDEA